MKSSKSLLTLVVVALFAAGSMFAADAKKDAAPVSKQAACCAKAEKDGAKCGHSCCAEAAKNGLNCTKCGGEGKIAAKPADAKK